MDRLTRIQKILKEKGKKPMELINIVLKFIDFKEAEIRLYNLLLDKEMTIAEIVRELKISERSVREHISKLYKKGFVNRKIVAENRLKYVYSSISPEIAWQMIKKNINAIINQIDLMWPV